MRHALELFRVAVASALVGRVAEAGSGTREDVARLQVACAVALAMAASVAAFVAPASAETTSEVRLLASVEPTRAAKRPQRLGLPPRPLRDPAARAAYLAKVRDLYERPADEWPAPTLDEEVEHRELGHLPAVVHPEHNPDSVEKRELGKLLFFDPRLSGSGQLACASCHDPDLGWGDGRTVSFGHNRRQLARNSPSVLNTAFRTSLFWDGRADSLEQQAQDVLANADEMHSGEGLFVGDLAKLPEYRERFARVFGDGEPTVERVALAVACYERSLVSTATRFDRFVGGRYGTMSDEEVSGLHLYRTDARCLNCHSGPNLTDDKFHNLGLTRYGLRFEDLGRYRVTEEPEDVGKFRTPSLRNVARTAPYMHNGLFDLDEVLLLYNAGMPNERRRRSQKDDPLFPTKSELVKPLGLNKQDLADLKAFLSTLTDSRRITRPPRLPAGL